MHNIRICDCWTSILLKELVYSVPAMTLLNPLYTGVAIVEKSLSDEKMGRSPNDLSKSTQRSPRSVNDRPVISTVAMVSSKFRLSPKQSLNNRQGKRSLSAQGALNDLSDLSVNAKFDHHEEEMAERSEVKDPLSW